jgi:hypothetical protein
MPHLPPAHHETSKHDSPNETKIKVKNRNVLDSNSNLTKLMTHRNQTKVLTTWFLKIHELSMLALHNAYWDVLRTKGFTELSPLHLVSRVSDGEVDPPCSSITQQLLSDKQGFLILRTVEELKLGLNGQLLAARMLQ